MNLHIIQHVPFEGPGYIADWAVNHGHELSYTSLFQDEYQFPNISDIDALIIMGGPMSVYDEERYPWLLFEKVYIKDCILAGKKVLGICLGAQLITTCLGASVQIVKEKEIGWYAVKPHQLPEKQNWLEQIFNNAPMVFHWHGEQFDIPDGASDLLYSDANDHQAYLFHKTVLALQFHLEATQQSIEAMLTNCGDELLKAKFIQSEEEIRQGFNHIEGINLLMERILNQFFEDI